MRKAHRSKKAQIDQLANALLLNGDAMRTEKHKALTLHDLRQIRPKTETQVIAFDAFNHYDHVVLNGSPGTGKTLLALYVALQSILDSKEQTHIKILRSAVPCRDQGFIKGTLAEKNQVYEAPYESLCYELLGKATAYEHLKKSGQVSFETTGYLRGVTLNDTVVIVDEAQNMSFSEMNTIVSRLGENSRMFICGDMAQCDLKKNDSGYAKALRVWENMAEFEIVTFTHDDILRNEVIKQWIIESEKVK